MFGRVRALGRRRRARALQQPRSLAAFPKSSACPFPLPAHPQPLLLLLLRRRQRSSPHTTAQPTPLDEICTSLTGVWPAARLHHAQVWQHKVGGRWPQNTGGTKTSYSRQIESLIAHRPGRSFLRWCVATRQSCCFNDCICFGARCSCGPALGVRVRSPGKRCCVALFVLVRC